MSQVARECWHCDICGFEWIKGKKVPEQCARSTCRSRMWDGGLPKKRGRKRSSKVAPMNAAPPKIDLLRSSAASARVLITCAPAGAEIEVDGIFLGCTPAELPLGAGERVLKITRKGCNEFNRKFQVLPGGKQRIVAELELLKTQGID